MVLVFLTKTKRLKKNLFAESCEKKIELASKAGISWVENLNQSGTQNRQQTTENTNSRI